VLRITIQTDADGSIFELEGRLAGPWVQELKDCWNRLVTGNSLVLNLKAVTFIDAQGKELLTEMHRAGANIAAEGCMTKAIVEEIQNDKVKPSGGDW
jgi:anti-anti-sigma regulatory factor